MRKWIIGLVLLVWAQAGYTLTVDVGMLTQLDGKVEILAGKAGKRPATAFLKVALGDRLVLGKDARVQIVYFETSRQEVWKGAGEVEIGNGEGRSSRLQPETRKLPPPGSASTGEDTCQRPARQDRHGDRPVALFGHGRKSGKAIRRVSQRGGRRGHNARGVLADRFAGNEGV
jgi:hypothetical protein